MIWFTPIFCKLVNINIRKYFKIYKHSNQYDIVHKTFSRKTFKISYSCTNNLKKINTHNTEVIRNYFDQLDNNNNNNNNNNNCGSKTKINCSMNYLCNLKNVVYQAIISPKKNV